MVRSQETYSVRHPQQETQQPITSEWIWVTTLPVTLVPTARVVPLGHQRWDIENYAFNELVTYWHADHIYNHDGHAIECFLLEIALAHNIFYAWLLRNVNPQLYRQRTTKFWAELMAAELRTEIILPHPP